MARLLLLALIVTITCLANDVVKAEDFTWKCPDKCICDESSFSVNCSRLGLGEYPTEIPTETQNLFLEFDKLKELPPLGLHYLGKLLQLDISSNELSISSFHENWFFGLWNLTNLDVSFNNLGHVPKYLPATLDTLRLIRNNIGPGLDKTNFANYTDLKYLDLSYNGITFIAADTFANNKKLDTLYIEFNGLTDSGIQPDIFKNLLDLQLLGLRFNALQSVPSNLPNNLTALDVVGNKIKKVRKTDLPFPKMNSFAIWQGCLEEVEDGAFEKLGNATIIDLNTNALTRITNLTFAGLESVKALYAYGNQIETIEPGAFQTFGSVEEIWLSSNNLTSLDPEVFTRNGKPFLRQVDIMFNPWTCDCRLRWLRQIMETNPDFLLDPHLVTCQEPEALKGKAWDVLKPEDFKC